MSFKLFIVESPKKAKTIRGYLGDQYAIKATMGHIREIPKKGLNIDIEKGFIPSFEIIASKKDTVRELKQLADDAESIFLATDPDREGEAIAWHVMSVIGEKNRKKCKRVVYQEITKNAILKAVANPRELNSAWVNAQRARQVLDRLIGYKVSPILWRTVASKTSAGRVQSIALKLICDRQREIDAFKPETFWYLDATLQTPKADKFIARCVTADKENRFSDQKLVEKARAALDAAKYWVQKVERTTKASNPFPPFDTTSMQKACSALFGWSLTTSMSVAQELYELGKISYHRTDSYNISDEAIREARDFIPTISDKKYLPAKPNHYKKGGATSQEAHECIRPTHIEDDGSDLSGDTSRLYDLIRSRFLACQSVPMLVDMTVLHVGTDTDYKLVAKGQVVKFDGWSKFYPYRNTEEQLLPDVSEKDALDKLQLKVTKGETKPPPRYNDGSITEKMEKEGVGRPATRAQIIKSIQDKGYVVVDKKAFLPTELGHRINDYLNPRFDDFFMDIKFTAKLEQDLDDILQGDKQYLEVVEPFHKLLLAKTKECGEDKKEQKPTGKKCPVCKKGEIVEKYGQFGLFFSCNAYPECKSIFVRSEDGEFSVKKPQEKVKTGHKCSVCKKGNIVERNGQYGKFFACDGYPACKVVYEKTGDTFSPKNRGTFSVKS